ncbi:hypothetical protein V528_06115 [Streptococcus thermophilus TH1436]|nr:hypothetical protein V528_06115 [Streptococcus thermophilus TH1436]EWM58361.1 hypothetical protein Y016_06455 [Streptococcus thermophilus TH985]EWM58522.1 hypothetical protein Y018_06475 [Streptococcus thermophilus TH982]CCC20210.1 hypothetical protein STH8232_1530 [Streptococcus thermophilus JIM 8232]
MGASPKIAETIFPIRTAPAVWLEEGPTMTGLMMSKTD